MKACFIGLGYIGLPTAIIAAHEGNLQAYGVDINPRTVEMTNAGKLHIIEPGLQQLLMEVVADHKLVASLTPIEADAYFIVVPTPFKDDHSPDVTYVEAATRSVLPLLKAGDLFVIESTSPVGTTEAMAELIYEARPELKDKIYIAYCPERVLPGNIIYELIHNDRVIGGITPEAAEKAKEFYARFVKGALYTTNSRTAEMCKLTENASRDVQIAFANELSLICDRAGIDVWELISLANRHPRVNILRPGCGVGGHCIAVDPYFITSAYPDEAKIIAEARRINDYKSQWCAQKITNAILRYRIDHGTEPTVALMGLAFKPDIDDLRESPSVKIAHQVIDDNPEAEILIAEPNIDVSRLGSFDNSRLVDYREAFERADMVAILTGHSQFKTLDKTADKVILDFCGIFK